MGYAAKAMKAAHDNMYVATPGWRGAAVQQAVLAQECCKPRPWPWADPLDLPIPAPEFVLVCILFGTPSKMDYVSCCLRKQISWNETGLL